MSFRFPSRSAPDRKSPERQEAPEGRGSLVEPDESPGETPRQQRRIAKAEAQDVRKRVEEPDLGRREAELSPSLGARGADQRREDGGIALEGVLGGGAGIREGLPWIAEPE